MRPATCSLLSAIPQPGNRSILAWLLTIPVTVTCQNGGVATTTATAQIVANLCNPPGTSPLCQVVDTPECGAGIVAGVIYVTVSGTILLTTVAQVLLLVPAYGYCTPAACPRPPPACPVPPPAACG